MYRLQVPKLHCEGCAGRVTRAITSVDPAARVRTDIPAHEVAVETSVPLAEIRAVLEKIGYPVAG
ncbi:MAG: heavy-metal-associated domain-containing protein [Geminicoccaceae bacterium]